MTRSRWKSLRDRLASDSPRAGGIEKVARELAGLEAQWRAESLRWPAGETADQLWMGAWTLDAVRTDLLRGRTTALDAHEWATAARDILDGFQYTRSRGNHPAGHAR